MGGYLRNYMDRENQKKQEENRVKRFCKCREEGGKVEMTHKVLSVLMIFVLGGFMGNIFQHDFHTEELYWTEYDSDENGYVTGGSVYLYHDTKTECIDHQILNNTYKYGENIVGVKGLCLNQKGFKGIVIYNVNNGEMQEILSLDRIEKALCKNESEWAGFEGCIQMSEDKDKFYFSYNDKLVCYDANQDELSIIEETYLSSLALNEKETGLYYSTAGKLMFYDFSTEQTEEICSGIGTFSLAKEDAFIVYVHKEKDEIWKYDFNSDKKEKLCDLKSLGNNQIVISEDNKCFVYMDSKESIIPTNFKYYIIEYNMENGRKQVLYKGKYGEVVNSLAG